MHENNPNVKWVSASMKIVFFWIIYMVSLFYDLKCACVCDCVRAGRLTPWSYNRLLFILKMRLFVSSPLLVKACVLVFGALCGLRGANPATQRNRISRPFQSTWRNLTEKTGMTLLVITGLPFPFFPFPFIILLWWWQQDSCTLRSETFETRPIRGAC